ncbi:MULTISPECIES: type II toxin-antitoxin system Phd/YefM family antitoxin [Moorena]|uniref:Antitoxin n=1 Tax=Moorena producens 3L TaxID=489825 RepID=F4Y3E2_9CYAN|nr:MULTISPECIES: type II toxin-antitoxin system Phd/YefM family antitoxin [Moorena]NES80549.1 type II toxin-antitoxin system Phd/YefM family antitoxin [Moorena sp. SIO2B7]EGJ28618.1 PhdYefM prevent-host-death family protein [Moorena producens 3L]NEP30236.1 type II toxin-antitoxin system Phd/YefM family antitoxin [Moorena sp. SIO3B2]NEP64259.1 type II toxin-antitoxin system Phd/YefM family antitoxin [Moorena sp. SIO3A5]NEQ04951.1 type II toxin-antitoxin system Phd/YefM family antitoxin [Moorena
MNSIPIKQFKTNIQDFIKQVINHHTTLKITDPNQGYFIIISAEDLEQQQETLYVLQNSHLMEQINHSQATHTQNKGYSPNQEELDDILSI